MELEFGLSRTICRRECSELSDDMSFPAVTKAVPMTSPSSLIRKKYQRCACRKLQPCWLSDAAVLVDDSPKKVTWLGSVLVVVPLLLAQRVP